jgi:hypothetical protein
LALGLGCSVRQIEQLTYAEVREWSAFYQIQPFGSERDNYHAALTAYMVANQNNTKKSQEIPFYKFLYTHADTARERRDSRTIAWLNSKAKKHG